MNKETQLRKLNRQLMNGTIFLSKSGGLSCKSNCASCPFETFDVDINTGDVTDCKLEWNMLKYWVPEYYI